MPLRIALATNVHARRSEVYEVLRTSEGQRAFWTDDCDLDDLHGRFGFAQAPVDLNVSVVVVRDELVRMNVDSGFPNWNGSTWEWTLHSDLETPKMTNVQFRHYGFEPGYEESDLASTAQTWAMILDRLVRFLESGVSDPFFAHHGA